MAGTIFARHFENALLWFFPRRCAFCGGVTEPHAALCADCQATAEEDFGAQAMDGVISCFAYRSPARRGFAHLKFEGRRALAPSIGRTMAEAFLQASPGAAADVLVCCVPMTPAQLRDRGYNQSLLLARFAARNLTAVFAPSLLRKTRETGTQHGLPAREREKNVRGAFAAESTAAGKRILLCDDVVTTGATLHACKTALLEAGAAQVMLLTYLYTVKTAHDA
ncbi:MAG: double zinc ribbon domain-containing protein [Oscillospiraceae bacterium]|jgi:ComF family protein|nr:double zinc ribbon domain-containing protein [Oscillospiraceae bacterium]